MDPNDQFVPIDDQPAWGDIIEELAEEPIRVLVLDPRATSRNACEVCHRHWFIGYRVWAENPFIPPGPTGWENWYKWGVVCFDCMSAVVASGGIPLRAAWQF